MIFSKQVLTRAGARDFTREHRMDSYFLPLALFHVSTAIRLAVNSPLAVVIPPIIIYFSTVTSRNAVSCFTPLPYILPFGGKGNK